MIYTMEVQKIYTAVVKVNAVDERDAVSVAEDIAKTGERWEEGETRTAVVRKSDSGFYSDYDLVKACRKKHNRDGDLPELKNRDILELRGVEELIVVDGIAMPADGSWVELNKYDKHGLFKDDDTYWSPQDDPRRWDIKRVLRFGIDCDEPSPIWEAGGLDEHVLMTRRRVTGQDKED